MSGYALQFGLTWVLGGPQGFMANFMKKIIFLAIALTACGERPAERVAVTAQPEAFHTYTLTNDISTICLKVSSRLHPQQLPGGSVHMRFDTLDGLSNTNKEVRFGKHIATISLSGDDAQRERAISSLSELIKQPVREDSRFIYIFPTEWRGGFVYDKGSAMLVRFLNTPNDIDLSLEKLGDAMLAIKRMRVTCPAGAT